MKTIEAAIIVPVILFIFAVLLHILFYWHDKNVLMSTAHETAALGSSRNEMGELELEHNFLERMEGKLLLFERVRCVVSIEDEKVTVVCSGSKALTQVKVTCSIDRTVPEDDIRRVRKLEKIGEGIVK